MSSVFTSGRLSKLSPRDILLSTLGNSFIWQFGWAWRGVINGSLSERRDVANRGLSSSAVIQYPNLPPQGWKRRDVYQIYGGVTLGKAGGTWEDTQPKSELRAHDGKWEKGPEISYKAGEIQAGPEHSSTQTPDGPQRAGKKIQGWI